MTSITMTSLPMTAEQAGHVAARAIAAIGREAWYRCTYADGALQVPEDLAETVSALDPDLVAPAALIGHLKHRRWEREIAGVTVEIGGAPALVSTARGDDRAALHQAFSAIGAGLRVDGAAFNFADGVPRQVSNADMMTAILAALAHVQQAFSIEAALTDEIVAGALLTIAEVGSAFDAAVSGDA